MGTPVSVPSPIIQPTSTISNIEEIRLPPPAIISYKQFIYENTFCIYLFKILNYKLIPSNYITFMIISYIYYLTSLIESYNIEDKQKQIEEILIYGTTYFYLSDSQIDKQYTTIKNILAQISGFIIFHYAWQVELFSNLILKYSRIISWNTTDWIVFFVVSILLYLPILIYLFYCSYKKKRLLKFCSIFLFIALYIFVSYFAFFKGEREIHIHHWFVFFVLGILAEHPTDFSKLIHSFSFGVFIQGTTTYNTDSIFTDK